MKLNDNQIKKIRAYFKNLFSFYRDEHTLKSFGPPEYGNRFYLINCYRYYTFLGFEFLAIRLRGHKHTVEGVFRPMILMEGKDVR